MRSIQRLMNNARYGLHKDYNICPSCGVRCNLAYQNRRGQLVCYRCGGN